MSRPEIIDNKIHNRVSVNTLMKVRELAKARGNSTERVHFINAQTMVKELVLLASFRLFKGYFFVEHFR